MSSSVLPINNIEKTTTDKKTTDKSRPIKGVISIDNGYIYIRISNPNPGKEGDLIQFYSEEYFNFLNIYPEIFLPNNHYKIKKYSDQNGGNNTNTNYDDNSIPYKYFKYFFDGLINIRKIPSSSNNINSISPHKSDNCLPKICNNINSISPHKSDICLPKMCNDNNNNDLKSKSIFNINPTIPHNPEGNILPNTHIFDTLKEDIIDDNSQETNVSMNTSILLKFKAKKIITLKSLLEKRNPKLNVTLTPHHKLTYLELNKIIAIKNMKKLHFISIDDIYYIDNCLIIIKGMDGYGLYNDKDQDKDKDKDNNLILNLKDDINIFTDTKLQNYNF